MEPRTRRIVEVAVQLAEEGGFEAVRLRDVAAGSGVALGTLYARFRSKEDILVAAIREEAGRLEGVMRQYPPEGETRLERVTWFFTLTTRALFARPKFARAVLRSLVTGAPEIGEKVTRFHGLITRMITAVLRGYEEGDDPGDAEPSQAEAQLGFLLQQIWFAALVGWLCGMHADEDGVIAHMRSSAELLLAGYEAKGG